RVGVLQALLAGVVVDQRDVQVDELGPRRLILRVAEADEQARTGGRDLGHGPSATTRPALTTRGPAKADTPARIFARGERSCDDNPHGEGRVEANGPAGRGEPDEAACGCQIPGARVLREGAGCLRRKRHGGRPPGRPAAVQSATQWHTHPVNSSSPFFNWPA